MRVHSTALWLPKDGNTADEYEDAVYPDRAAANTDATEFKCAVADGATETSFANLWAKLLVCGYAEDFDLERMRQEWNDQVHGKELPWYAEQKVVSGAFAALVGLTISDDGRWQSQAIGDSCLLQVRDRNILFSFPMILAESFNNSPYLLSTADTKFGDELPEKKDGEWKKGDIFLLMTDAISHWTIKRQEDHHDAWQWIERLTDQEAFLAFVELERRTLDPEGRPILRNDDVTLLRVDML